MKREEAIERIKSRYDKWALDDEDLEAIQCTFPELAESEDERIRIALCNIVRDMPYMETELRAHGLTVEKTLAYLEKMKEEEGYEAIPVESTLEYKLGFKAGRDFEKQKEQKPEEKPINWTELTWEDINELEDIINKVHYEFRNGIGQESFGKEVLEKFREYKGDEYLDEIEQKPDIELIQRSWYMEGYHDGEFNMEPKWTVKAEKGGPRYYENPNYGKPLEQMSDYKVGDKISWEGKEYSIDKVVCGDDRFEIIDRAKQDLLEETNIADSPEEMAVLGNFLFRCWQMGWLKKYEVD